jgi:DNA polymerase III alpha subunit (gram-positive type)
LGTSVANKIVEARDTAEYTSLIDFKKRSGTNSTSSNKMNELGLFDDFEIEVIKEDTTNTIFDLL